MSTLAAFAASLSAGATALSAAGPYAGTAAYPVTAPAGDLRNPDLDAMTGWLSTNSSEMFLSGGKLHIVNSANQFFYQPWQNYVQTPVSGVPYRMAVLITALTSGAVRLVTNSFGLDITYTAPGYYVVDYTGDGDAFNFQSVPVSAVPCNAEIEWVQLTRQ